MKIYRSLFLLLITLAIPNVVLAANHYVRAGATGASNGDDWTNAYTSLPATLVRGDTYYIADGTYGGYRFDDPGTSTIYIKKAIGSIHGTDAGWDSTYGEGRAIFAKWTFSGTDYVIDGQTGQWAPDLPNYAAHGFKVYTRNTSANQNLIEGIAGSGNVIIRHTEAAYSNTPRTDTWYSSSHIVRGYGGSYEFQYCWFHDAENGIYNGYLTSTTFDHSVIERNGQGQVAMNFSPSEHSEIAAIKGSGVNFTFRHGYIRDWRSTGGIIIFQTNATVNIYGNIISQTGYWSVPGEANDSNGILSALSHDTTGMKAYAYNNTFANLKYGSAIWSGGVSYAARTATNNIFYNCNRASSSGAALYGTHDYNWFYNSGTQSETHMQNGSGNPFVDSGRNNYQLMSPLNAALSLSAEYNKDMLGITRGSDGTWDRGALEFTSGGIPAKAAPSPPSNLRIAAP